MASNNSTPKPTVTTDSGTTSSDPTPKSTATTDSSTTSNNSAPKPTVTTDSRITSNHEFSKRLLDSYQLPTDYTTSYNPYNPYKNFRPKDSSDYAKDKPIVYGPRRPYELPPWWGHGWMVQKF